MKDAIASIYFKKNQKNFESVESVLDYINRYLCVDTKWVGEIEALVIMVLYDVKVKVLTSHKIQTTDHDGTDHNEKFLPCVDYEASFASESLLQMDHVRTRLDERNPSATITIFFHQHNNPFILTGNRKNHYLYLYPVSDSYLNNYFIVSEPSNILIPISEPELQRGEGFDLEKEQTHAGAIQVKLETEPMVQDTVPICAISPPKNDKPKKKRKEFSHTPKKEKYRLVRNYVDNRKKYKSIREYLRSEESDPLNVEQRSSFQRWCKEYNCGKVNNAAKEIKKLNSYTQQEKYRLVKYFVENQKSYKSIRAYLRSAESDPLKISQRSPFQRWLQDYKCGTLNDTAKANCRKRYSALNGVESKLLEYMMSQQALGGNNKDDLSFKDLKTKALSIWEHLPLKQKEGLKTKFSASDGWLRRFLKREDMQLRTRSVKVCL